MNNEQTSLVSLRIKDKLNAVFIFALSALIVLGFSVVKFYFIDDFAFVKVDFLIFCLAILFIFACQLTFVLFSRRNLVAITKQLFAVEICIVLSYIACLYFSLVSFFCMPVALAAFLIAPISKRRDAFVGNLVCNIMVFVAMLFDNNVTSQGNIMLIVLLFIVGVMGGSVAAYIIAISTKRIRYIVKGVLIGFFSYALIFVITLKPNFVSSSMYFNLGMCGVGVFSPVIIGLVMQPILEKMFNLITNSRLVELTDHNSPLIKRLIVEAPGTFNHSLAVANFAEMCATAIGVNPYLARACAYYHDIGKITSPLFFKENQAGFNPHDEILPEVSADIIRAHTTEGLKLCNKFRIPAEVSSVTIQHHGTLCIPVFLNKAKKLTDSDVNDTEYRYHGVTPRTKIAAIIMLCDASEAAIRSIDDPNGEKIDKLLRSIISQRLSDGQFDHCDITMNEINTIRETIINAFGGLYHKRLKYPDGKK